VPGRALIGIGTAMLTTGLLAGCGAVNEQWDLPMSPLNRPTDVPLQGRDICTALEADPISGGCRIMTESGRAEIDVVPHSDTGLDPYADLVDGDKVRWVGVSRFPAIQLANGSGSDGQVSCRVLVDVAPGQVLVIVYRQEAADPKLAPCRPARDYAAKALAALQAPT
jgi:hypothetical protein